MRRMVPSLVDLCVQTAVDNVRYLGDVGETDIDLLGRILPHCSLEQLKHVEKSTEVRNSMIKLSSCSVTYPSPFLMFKFFFQGRDLSQVTDRLWKRFYQIEFGDKSLNQVVERMKQKKVTFKWKKLYEVIYQIIFWARSVNFTPLL